MPEKIKAVETIELKPDFGAMRVTFKREAEIWAKVLPEQLNQKHFHKWLAGVTIWMQACENSKQIEEVQEHMSRVLTAVAKVSSDRDHSETVFHELLVSVKPETDDLEHLVSIRDLTDNVWICKDYVVTRATQAMENTLEEYADAAGEEADVCTQCGADFEEKFRGEPRKCLDCGHVEERSPS